MKTHKKPLRQARKTRGAENRPQPGEPTPPNPMAHGGGYVCSDDTCYVPTDEFALGRRWLVVPD